MLLFLWKRIKSKWNTLGICTCKICNKLCKVFQEDPTNLKLSKFHKKYKNIWSCCWHSKPLIRYLLGSYHSLQLFVLIYSLMFALMVFELISLPYPYLYKFLHLLWWPLELLFQWVQSNINLQQDCLCYHVIQEYPQTSRQWSHCLQHL